MHFDKGELGHLATEYEKLTKELIGVFEEGHYCSRIFKANKLSELGDEIRLNHQTEAYGEIAPIYDTRGYIGSVYNNPRMLIERKPYGILTLDIREEALTLQVKNMILDILEKAIELVRKEM